MRTFLGLCLAALAGVLLTLELLLLADAAAVRAGTVFPFAPQPWYVGAVPLLGVAVLGWMAARLLSGGIVGRLVRGRGLTPEPPQA